MTSPAGAVLFIEHDSKMARPFAALKPKILRSSGDIQHAFDSTRSQALWIAPSARSLGRLAMSRRPRMDDHRVLVLGRVDGAAREILHALFRFVVARAQGVKLLPNDHIAEVMAAPNRADLFIGGAVDKAARVLVLYRGNLESLVVPLAWFARAGGVRANPAKFEIIDYGQTVRLGAFEAATDAILYEFDADARKRAKSRGLANDASFGGALRRLRKQKGVGRGEFAGISAKEIGRIERGEVTKPHADTVQKIAQRLGVTPEELKTF